MKKLLTLIVSFCPLLLFSQGIDNLEITLPTTEMRIDSVFSVIKKQQNIVFSYGNSLNTETLIRFEKTKLTVSEILKHISSQAELNYKIQGNKVMLYLKKKKHYINGVINDKATGEAIPGTNIRLKGTNFGTSTDEHGQYKLRLEEGDYVLTFSFIGYEAIEKPVSVMNETELNIALNQATNNIDEVKVTKQRNFWRNLDIGRNITTLDSKKLESLNSNNAADILQASIPGVWSTQMSGAPGDHQKVKIRGINSIFGCTDPLYMIDGVAVPIVNLHSLGIGDLNVHDIESITVLKDASSTAIYGYQGANGVIIIDTKRGGENHISFSTKFGIQRLPHMLTLMNSKDFLTTLDSALVKMNGSRRFYPAYSDTLKNTDWQNSVFHDGMLREYQLAGSGKVGKTNFYVSGNYYSHEGILINSNYDRYTGTANLNHNFTDKLALELNVRTSYQKNKNNLDTYNGNDNILECINKSPLYKSTPDSFYLWPFPYVAEKQQLQQQAVPRTYYAYGLANGMSKTHPDSIMKRNANLLNISSTAFDLRAKYTIADNLFLNAASSLTVRNHSYETQLNYGMASQNRLGYYKESEDYLLLNQQVNLNYQKFINRHEFQVTAGYRNYVDHVMWKTDTVSDYFSTNFLKNSLSINGKHGSILRQIQSFSTLLNYNFSKKYFLSFVANYESLVVSKTIGYSQLYPSVSANWNIANEPVFNRLGWLNELSVFANWGRVGNMPLNALATDMYEQYGYNYGDTIIRGRSVAQFANHFMKPEIVNETNLGITIGLFNNRIRGTFDYYSKMSENLIMIRDIPLYYGSSDEYLRGFDPNPNGRMMINIGKVINNGKEFNIDADIIKTSNFSWSASFAISSNHLRVKEIGKEKELQFASDDILIPRFEVKSNAELGVIKGFKYLGDWTEADAQAADVRYAFVSGAKFLNSDTTNKTLNDKDLVVLGKTLPDYTWHCENTFSYKNLSLSMLWYGVQGVSKYNGTKASTYMAGLNRDVALFVKETKRIISNTAFYRSSYFVEDASFIRLKQVTLSYLMPRKLFNKADLRLSLSFENFITLTKYTGYDPEASIYTDNSFSDYAVDRGAYPNPKSVFVTLNLDF